jgi:carbamoyltransferase
MTAPVRILGLSAYYHDSAAALLVDGEIAAAAQEERFSRVKGDNAFPHRAVAYCLDAAGIREEELDHVVYYESPLAKFERLTTTHHLAAPFGLRGFLAAFPPWLTKNLWLGRLIPEEMGLAGRRLLTCDHHLSHAASAFYPSPFERAAILTVDGVGEWSTATCGVGEGSGIRLLSELRFPNSVGLLYSAFTYFTGFKINSGEYKLMGLAPYGRPVYADLIRTKLASVRPDGSVALNQRYFDYVGGLAMTNRRFERLFGGPPRKPETPITQREMDLAASIQEVVNDVVLKMAGHARRLTGEKNLCLAGGVALNVVATGQLLREGPFEGVWVQPAAGDAGGALGAALWVWHEILKRPRCPDPMDSMRGAFLGPEILPASQEDDRVLAGLGASWESLPEDELKRAVAGLVKDGKVVGIARGRMEWGPRALGARSILGDARSPGMQRHMNLKIKFRESFRPFAPMVLEEDAAAYFEGCGSSPYMLFAFPVSAAHRTGAPEDRDGKWGIELLSVPRSTIPAVTHLDYSARVQTVDRRRNPFMHGVLSRFKEETGCPVMVNTSFNVRGEPIVCTAEEAYRCFMATQIDALVVGNRLLSREAQRNRPLSDGERARWLKRFDLD